MKKIRIYLATALATFFAISGALAFAAPVSAGLFDGSKEEACKGANLDEKSGCTASPNDSKVSDTLKTVLNILSIVAGVVAVIMIIIGGLRFITSQGEGSSTALARNTVIYAVVGIVIVMIAQILVKFVIGRSASPAPTTSEVAPEKSLNSDSLNTVTN